MPHPNKRGIIARLTGSLFKALFYLLYNHFAWTYDWVADVVSIGRWRTWIYCSIPYLESSKILELGHGPGHLQIAVAKKEISIFGIDASQNMVKLASARLQRNRFPSNLVLGKSQYLPYPDQSFKIIVATFPSEYINDHKTLTEVWRVLDNSGELIVLAGAWITGRSWLDRGAAFLFRVTGQAPIIDDDNISDQNFFQLNEVEGIGFRSSTEIIDLETSKIILIRAKKITNFASPRVQ